MNLQSWAELLCDTPESPIGIDLRVQDAVAAFLAGIRTNEARSLSQLIGGSLAPIEMASTAAAILRLAECDDIHLQSCITPGSVVIPVALALAADRSGNVFNRAVAAGYAAGLRLGISIGGGKALAGGVWPTLLAAPLMAAVTASCLDGHNPVQLAHAMGLALAGASGRIGRPTGTPSGRWLAFAEAVAKGMRASEAAGRGFRGDLTLISEQWLAAQAGHEAIDMTAFDISGPAPSIAQVDFKPFPVARQAANAVLAFQLLLSKGLDPHRIESVQVFVPAINLALLSRSVSAQDRLSRLCNMGFQLACAAFAPEMLYNCERAAPAGAPFADFARRVSVMPAQDLETYLPDHWAARVVVNAGGEIREETVIRTPFDHDAQDIRERLAGKWRRLLSIEEGRELFGAAAPHAILWPRIEQRIRGAAGLER